MPNTRQRAFTLIELLVVVAIIGLLVALIVPALSAARRTAWRSVDLQNLRQIMIASASYQLDHDAIPVELANEGFAWNRIGWLLGGKSTTAFFNNSTSYKHETEKTLNPYIYDDLQRFERDTFEPGPDEDRPERTFFRSPADGGGSPELADHVLWYTNGQFTSAYESFGTSYFNNTVLWDSPGYESPFSSVWSQRYPGVHPFPARFNEIAQDFVRRTSPSRQVIVHEATIDFAGPRRGTGTSTGLMGQTGKYIAGFGDGTARIIEILPEDVGGSQPGQGWATPPRSSTYTFVSERYAALERD